MNWYRQLMTAIEASGLDWLLHLVLGVTVVLVVLTISGRLRPWLRALAAILAMFGIAVAFELFDLHFDWQDVFEQVAAAAVGVGIWRLAA